jgi:hypothetical protein
LLQNQLRYLKVHDSKIQIVVLVCKSHINLSHEAKPLGLEP